MKLEQPKYIRKDGLYELTADYVIVQTGIRGFAARVPGAFLAKTGSLTLYEGYRWDGPSGPAIDTENTMAASAAHDALYCAISKGLLRRKNPNCRKLADKLYKKLLRQSGMNFLRRMRHYYAVRGFGGFFI